MTRISKSPRHQRYRRSLHDPASQGETRFLTSAMKLQTCLNLIASAGNLNKDRLVWIDRDANVWRVLSVFVAI